MSTLILGIESSCDESAAAVLKVDGEKFELLSSVVSSQVKLHARYGGVVPELASRAHLQNSLPVIQEALTQAEIKGEQLDAITVTAGPGLIGALLVGLQVAKSLAYVWGTKLIGVNHLDGHLQAIYLEETPPPSLPFVALLVSGGHTALYHVTDHTSSQILGATRDDAAGEAYDKAAKMMGLPYPGGVYIDRLAQTGNIKQYSFPRPMLHKGLDFSFSGLKTSCRNLLKTFDTIPEGEVLSDICASYQEAIVDILWKKSLKALKQVNCKQLVVTGGVAANSRLRSAFVEWGKKDGIEIFLPSRRFCTDNAAMIACAGYRKWQVGEFDDLTLNAYNRAPRRSSHHR